MIGSLFSGIGGLELGLEMAGLGPVAWQCEQDPWCRKVATRYEDVPGCRAATKTDLWWRTCNALNGPTWLSRPWHGVC